MTLLALLLHPGAPATALDIQFIYHGEFSRRADAVAGMERAARMWEAVLDDPVTVTIDVRELPIQELGFTQGATYRTFYPLRYDLFRRILAINATSADDAVAVAHLPAGDQLVFRAVDPQGNIVIDDGGENINRFLDLTSANAKALRLADAMEVSVDAEIEWNAFMLDNGRLLDLDRADGIGIDFVSVAAHEIGHALGLISGADDFDYFSLPNGPDAPQDLSEFAALNPLDLFRYTAESLPLFDVAPRGDPYFSIDGGATRLADFATGLFNGDGLQAGHWRGNTGLMDALLADGVAHEFSLLDLVAFDVLGWDVSPPVPGDYNASRSVDQGDLELVLLNWGADSDGAPNDWLFHLPRGVIDQAELDDVLLHWGQTVATARNITAPAGVPEPTTLLLTAIFAPAAAIPLAMWTRKNFRKNSRPGIAIGPPHRV